MLLVLLLILNCQQFRTLSHLMHILQNLYYLWHHNHLLNNLLQYVRNLYQNLLLHCNLIWSTLNLLHYSHHLLYVVYVLYHLLHLLQYCDLLYCSLHFKYSRLHVSYLHQLLPLHLYLTNLLNYPWYLNDLLNYPLYVLIHSNYLRNYSLHLNDLWNLNQLWNDFLHFINSRNCS